VTSVSRRGLVRAAVLAGPLALLAADRTVSATGAAPRALPVAVRSASPTPSPAASATPRSSGTAGGSMPVQSRPVYTLAEYRALVPGPAFPAHAIALTIDDGPHPVWTPKVLSLLDRFGVPATFCLIGNQVRGHESVARSVVSAGHNVANHSYNHPIKLPAEAPDQMHSEISRAQDKIYSATGFVPRLFRSPGGSWSPQLFSQTAQAGLIPVDWSDDPRDWSRPGTALITQRLLAAKAGQILLCHDGGGDRSQTYAALQTVIPALLARGYAFVSL
jgi:peptidoglycan/xylan/chitin deacetylase (PgdA/CDA1 family)